MFKECTGIYHIRICTFCIQLFVHIDAYIDIDGTYIHTYIYMCISIYIYIHTYIQVPGVVSGATALQLHQPSA